MAFDPAKHPRGAAGEWVEVGSDEVKQTFLAPIGDVEKLADPLRLERVRDTPAAAELAAKIRAEGFDKRRALVVDTYRGGDMGLGDGYHRLAAAKAAGLKKVHINVYRDTPEGRRAANRQTMADESARVGTAVERSRAHEMFTVKTAIARSRAGM